MSYLLKIKPQLEKSDTTKMFNDLGKRFTTLTKKFGSGLKNAFKSGIKGAAIAGIVGAILNPIREANDALNNLLSKGDNIDTRARQLGTTNANYLRLQTAAQAKGIDQASFDNILSRFQTTLAKAQGGEKNVLSQFAGEKDTAVAFYKAVQSLKALNQNERALATSELFGEKSVGKMAEFLESDIGATITDIFKNYDNSKINKVTGRLAELEEEQALLTAKRELDDMFNKAAVTNSEMLRAQDAGERAKNDRTTQALKNYKTMQAIEKTVEELKTTLISLVSTLSPLLLPAAEALSKIASYLEKLTPYIQTGVDWLKKIFDKLSGGIFGWKGK